MIPALRPMQSRVITASDLVVAGITAPFAILVYRGYYRDTMGAPGRNDRGCYDDAAILYAPCTHMSFNANADPSTERAGIATLQPGRYRYIKGLHRGRPALIQAGPVIVRRDGLSLRPEGKIEWPYGKSLGDGRWTDEGCDWKFMINIHDGGYGTTSSLGCQTIPPQQWAQFRDTAFYLLRKYQQTSVDLLLIERQG